MTTYTDLIQKMDNRRYIGKINQPIKRVNVVYELMINGSVRHTEYTNNPRTAQRVMADRLALLKRKAQRLGLDGEDLREAFADVKVRITDRDGKVTEETLS